MKLPNELLIFIQDDKILELLKKKTRKLEGRVMNKEQAIENHLENIVKNIEQEEGLNKLTIGQLRYKLTVVSQSLKGILKGYFPKEDQVNEP